MEEADRLSTTALAVALFALIVASLQLLQQVFGTADGWRRCKEPALGPWARLSRAPWHWTEFRYETMYTVPHLEMRQLAAMYDQIDGSFPLEHIERPRWQLAPLDQYTHAYHIERVPPRLLDASRRSDDQKLDEIEQGRVSTKMPLKAWHKTWRWAFRWPIPIPGLRNHLVRSHYDSILGSVLQDTVLSKHDSVLRSSSSSKKADPVSLASWIALLNEAYKAETVAQNRMAICCRPETLMANGHAYNNQDISKMQRTGLVLEAVEHSWDFTSDVLKPQASATISTTIVIASRMGMSPKTIRGRSIGISLEASSTNYSLVSISDDGPTLLQFRIIGEPTEVYGKLIPTVSSDKMIFGIIPGCDRLRYEDIDLVDDDGRLALYQLFNRLPFSSDAAECADRAFKTASDEKVSPILEQVIINDIITLLCPFFPVAGPDLTTIRFSAWAGGQQASSFHRAGMRIAMRKFAERRVKQLAHLELPQGQSERHKKAIGELRQAVEYLANMTADEFDVSRRAPDESASRAACRMDLLRTRFDFTDTFFIHHCNEWDISYLSFVAAHAALAFNALQEVNGRFDQGTLPELLGGVHPKWIQPRYYGLIKSYEQPEFMNAFIACIKVMIEDREGSSKTVTLDDTDDIVIETAWWMLMLRGRVWDMSVDCDTTGHLIPSSYYNDSTRVWFT